MLVDLGARENYTNYTILIPGFLIPCSAEFHTLKYICNRIIEGTNLAKLYGKFPRIQNIFSPIDLD